MNGNCPSRAPCGGACSAVHGNTPKLPDRKDQSFNFPSGQQGRSPCRSPRQRDAGAWLLAEAPLSRRWRHSAEQPLLSPSLPGSLDASGTEPAPEEPKGQAAAPGGRHGTRPQRREPGVGRGAGRGAAAASAGRLPAHLLPQSLSPVPVTLGPVDWSTPGRPCPSLSPGVHPSSRPLNR